MPVRSPLAAPLGAADTVIDPPSETDVLLIVIDELVSDALAILESVLLAPLIDLFESVSVVARPT